MRYVNVKGSDLRFSQISLGTMRLVMKKTDENGNKIYVGKSVEEVETLLKAALDLGINLIDTADIYGHGLAEELLGKVLEKNPDMREKIILQTKCAVVSTSEGMCYNVSKEYILECVNASLKRLHTDYIDVLLLHKPDPLYDPAEISGAFKQLYEEGKVRNFGLSNFTSMQTSVIQKYCSCPIAFNQLQFSIAHSLMIDAEVNVNTTSAYAVNRDTELLDYCRLNDIRIEAYSVVQGEGGTFINNPKYEKLNRLMEKLCEKYHTNKNAIAIAWILHHPSGIIPTLGTTSVEHLKASMDALNFTLTRQEWFDLYLATEKPLP